MRLFLCQLWLPGRCNFGFRLLGSRRRLCLPISLWGGLPAYCKRKLSLSPLAPQHPLNHLLTAIKCPRLRKPNYGEIYPRHCSTKKSAFGDQCAFACKTGFRLEGPSLRQCGGRGSWSGGRYMSRCVDHQPPSITCPANVTAENDKNTFYTSVSWRQPVSRDNSGFHPIVSSVPVVSSPGHFKIGTTDIRVRYTAGNPKPTFSVHLRRSYWQQGFLCIFCYSEG